MATRAMMNAGRFFGGGGGISRVKYAPWGLFVSKTLFTRALSGGAFINKEEVSDRVLTVIKNFEKVDVSAVCASSKFIDDLGLDSLDTVRRNLSFSYVFCSNTYLPCTMPSLFIGSPGRNSYGPRRGICH